MKKSTSKKALITACCLLGVSVVAPLSAAEEAINLSCQALVFTKRQDSLKSVRIEDFVVHVHRNSRLVAVDVSGDTHIHLDTNISRVGTLEHRQLLEITESEFNVETLLDIKGRYEKQILQINSSGKLIYTSWLQKEIAVNAEGKCEQPWLLFAPQTPLD